LRHRINRRSAKKRQQGDQPNVSSRHDTSPSLEVVHPAGKQVRPNATVACVRRFRL
jgi:hypothetical protein